ncbi:MAG: hypothetical protein LBV31_01510, partial [Prevotellaceae bacterium]|nr:hypothetical protein [Prevotellaceae bacterium]
MQIGRKDIAWNFAGTFMRIASGLIVLPLVLRKFPTEEYGLWVIFITIGTVATLLDFGFNNAFGRNITYIFSGVKKLVAKGYIAVPEDDNSIDYNLLKSTITAIKKYYAIIAGVFLALFFTVGTFYFASIVLTKYSGNHTSAWLSWLLYGISIAYQLYTYYYSALLTGRGLIKRNQQTIIIGQTVRIASISVMIFLNFGLIALVAGQILGDFTTRTLAYYAFYNKKLKANLTNAIATGKTEIMKIMMPNAAKIGLTSLGGFMVTRASVLIAPNYLTLSDIGEYGLTKQMIDLIAGIGSIWFATFYPKITFHRVHDQTDHLKRMYIKGKLNLIATFLICGAGLILVGPYVLQFIKSPTHLLPSALIAVLLVVSFLESNHAMSGQILLTKNEVPFAKASILSGTATVILLFLGLNFTNLGVWAMILAPGIAQASYQNWKWSSVVIKDLKIRFIDYFKVLFDIIKINKYMTSNDYPYAFCTRPEMLQFVPDTAKKILEV